MDTHLELFMKKGISVYGMPNFWIGFYLCGIWTSSHSFQNIGWIRRCVFLCWILVNCEGPQWRARPICRQDSTVHPKSVHFTQFYIAKHMEEYHHWEYREIEADSRLGPTIRNILVAPTRPLQFIWRNSVKNWWSNAHYKFFVISAVSLIYLSLSILHQIGCGNLHWSRTN